MNEKDSLMIAHRLPELCLRLGMIYLLIGMGLGLFMGANEDFTFSDVHAHINLLGYVSTFLIGLFLKFCPQALNIKPTRIAVSIILASTPVMLLSLAAMIGGMQQATPILGIASTVVMAGYALFCIAAFRATAK